MQNLLYDDGAIAKIWYDNWCDNFHADLKNLIGFAVIFLESSKPAPYFEGISILYF